jgi:hypothetical protein
MPHRERQPEAAPPAPAPAPEPPPPHPARPVDQWQHTLGNQTIQDLVRAGTLQTKSTHDPSADALEQEANRTAETFSPPAPATTVPVTGARKSDPPTPPHPRPLTLSSSLPPALPEPLTNPGQPLDPATRQRFEIGLGVGLQDVRVHTDSQASASAQSLAAHAYTTGRHVVFAEGQYRPGTPTGDRLLAHELAHVVQQSTRPAGGTPQLQRQPAATGPNLDQVLATLAAWVTSQGTQADPAEIRSALQALTGFGVTLASVQFTRLANATWVIGGLHIGAESRWPSGGAPEIAPSDDLLNRFHLYQTNRAQHRDVGFSIIRTLAHELRHLQRQQQRDAGTRGPTTAERRFEAEITRLAAATPARLTPQEFAEVYTGRVLHAQVAYPVEEVFARLAEVEFARREWVARQAQAGGPTQADREHLEDVLWEIGFRIAYQVTMLRNTASSTTAGFTPGDLQTSIGEIETEINQRYGRQSPERRMWDLVLARRFHQGYAPQIIGLQPGGTPGGYQPTYQTLVVVLPQIFP